MKFPGLMLSAVLLSVTTIGLAQTNVAKSELPKSDTPKAETPMAGAPKTDAPISEGQKSFDQMKSLAGTWLGRVSTDPPMPEMGDKTNVQITMHVTSRGNALVHEMMSAGITDDPTKNDHPVTMFYLDNDRLLLTHYCDAGNRPRMVARTSPDGKTLEFDFLDVAGSTQYGHMQHAAFTVIDANHHTEDWTFLMPGDKPMRGHMDLQRTK